MVFRWNQQRAVAVILLMALGVSVCYPRTYSFLYRRLFQAPSGIMEARVDMIKTALDLWKRDFLFGCGPGNYIEAYSRPDVRKQQVPAKKKLPVHNAFLWVAAELGLFGVISFFGMIFMAMRRCWRPMVCDDMLIRVLSLAVFAAFWGYLADGINNPMFRQTVPYTQLWVFIGMSVALHRLWVERMKA
jgi:O-antigen ligase